MARTLVLPPLLLAGGLVILGSSFAMLLFAAVQVAQRSINYGLLGPAREMLFTVVDRETKYKSKNFIDTVVFRGADVAASWIFKGLMSAGFSLSSVVWMYLPALAIWGAGAWRLGKYYETLRSQADGLPKEG